MSDTAVQRFKKLFTGLDRAYGTYEVTGQDHRGKLEGKAITHKQPLTEELYRKHLYGEQGLGIIPIMSDSTCWFGALDVDDYTQKYMDVLGKVNELKLPFVPCLSKSAGVHLYLFFTEPLPCKYVRAKLKEFAVALGLPNVEVFSKQDTLRADELGNWLNAPYFKGALGPLHAERVYVRPDTGEKIATLETFLDLAEAKRVSKEQLDQFKFSKRAPAPFSDAPPCLQKLSLCKASEGGRNNAMFQFAVYLRQKHANDMDYSDIYLIDRLKEVNRQYFDPPLPDSEIVTVGKSAYKAKHFYRCDQQPMADLCDKSTCLTRRYGVGRKSDTQEVNYELEWGRITKYVVRDESDQMVDEPWYHWTINGTVLHFSNEIWNSAEKFVNHIGSVLNVYVKPMKPDAFNVFRTAMLADHDEVAVSFDGGPTGQLIGQIKEFIRKHNTLNQWETIHFGDVYVDKDAEPMRAWFRSPDLMQFLRQKGMRLFNVSDVYEKMRTYMDGIVEDKNIKGRTIKVWGVLVSKEDLQASGHDTSATVF